MISFNHSLSFAVYDSSLKNRNWVRPSETKEVDIGERKCQEKITHETPTNFIWIA